MRDAGGRAGPERRAHREPPRRRAGVGLGRDDQPVLLVGLQAIAFAAERIMCGFASAIVAGGTESMSLVPMGGNKLSPNPALVDSYPDVYLTTGLVAENHARESGISREAQDAFALDSHQRAIAAADGGRFADEIVPVTARVVDARRETARSRSTRDVVFAADEGPRRDTSPEALAKLRPAFHATGTVTAGNSSQTSDGAAAVIVTSAAYAPRARPDAAGAVRRVRHRRRRARTIRHRTGAGRPESAQARRPDARSDGPGRAQRGVRRAGAGLPEGAADRSRIGSTSTAARSRSAIRSAAPAPS